MRFAYDSPHSVLAFALDREPMNWDSLARSPFSHGAHKARRGALLGLFAAALLAGVGATPAEAQTPSELAAETSSASSATFEGDAQVIEDTDYGVSLRNLEEKVNTLKEKVFRSKARLVLLRETVLNGVISGARAVIRHRNEMGSSFTLERATYTLDGEPLFNKIDDDGSLDGQTEIELFEGSIVPGTHNLSVQLVYRGNGYGIFTYLRDYTFKLRTSYPFTAEEGKVVSVRAVAYEKGGITTDLTDRPSMRFETEVKQDVRVAGAEDEATP